jgi:hypothetical protein
MASLMPQGKQQYVSSTGAPLVGGKVYTYAAGTTTPLATYTDAGGGTPNTNPVILDSRGEASIFFSDNVYYKIVLKDSADATIWTQDNLPGNLALAALAASGGSALVGYLPAGTSAVATIVQTKLRESVSVKDFGAVGDGVTNDLTAITNALTALIAKGGGDLLFPNTTSNIYYVGTAIAGSTNIPVLTDTGTAFTAVSTSIQYQFYLLNKVGIRFIGNGITVKSGVTSGGTVFLFDGCRDIGFIGVGVQSVMTFNSGTGAVTQTGMGGVMFASTAQDSERITIKSCKFTDCYNAIYAAGDGASSYRLRGVDIENVSIFGGNYGIALHNNGDLVNFRNVRTYGVNARSYFVYGVQNHTGVLQVTNPGFNNLFGQVMVKAYDYNTSDITLKVVFGQQCNGGVYQVNFQSQHYTATQPVAASVTNVTIDIDDSANTTGSSVNFAYYQGAVSTATISSSIFDTIKLTGKIYSGSNVVASVVQSNNYRGLLDVTTLNPVVGALSILSAKGFYATKYQTYVPTISFGGNAVGVTYNSGTIGEWYQIGSIVFGEFRIKLTSKGSSTGSLAVTLPVVAGAYASGFFIGNGLGVANMSGLSGPLAGYIPAGTSTILVQIQGAAGMSSATDTNLTNTSDFSMTFMYPV